MQILRKESWYGCRATWIYRDVSWIIRWAAPKKIIKIDEPPLIIIEMDRDLSQDEVDRIQVTLKENYGEQKFLILPKGSKVTVACKHGFVAKEKLGEYEYEIHAKDEDTAKKWMWMDGDMWPK